MSATASTESLPARVEGPAPGTVRCAGLGALVVAALHSWAALVHHHDLLFTALIAAMTVGCVACAVRCLRTPCTREARALLVMSAAMAVAHVVWLLAAGGHDHSAMSAAASHGSAGLTMAGLALAEVGVTALCGAALRESVPRGAAPRVRSGR